MWVKVFSGGITIASRRQRFRIAIQGSYAMKVFSNYNNCLTNAALLLWASL